MLRIGPTIYNHTPYARVHSAFLPLFESAIRQRALPRSRKLTLFCDFSRLRIALSLDKNMADENDGRGGSAGCELAVLLNWRQVDLSPHPLGYCRCHPHSVRVRDASRYFRMPSRPVTIKVVHSAKVWQPGAGKQALAYKRRVEWRSTNLDNRADGAAPLPAVPSPLFSKSTFMPFQSPAPSPSSPLAIEPISMRIPDACRYTGISRSSLYLLIARGEVEIVKMGAATLVLTESLRDLIERQRGTSTSRTAAPIRRRSDQDEVRKSGQPRRRRTANDFASIPLFERD